KTTPNDPSEIGRIPCGLISDWRLTHGPYGRGLVPPGVLATRIRLAGCGTNKAATKVLLESDIDAAWMNVIPSKWTPTNPTSKDQTNNERNRSDHGRRRLHRVSSCFRPVASGLPCTCSG